MGEMTSEEFPDYQEKNVGAKDQMRDVCYWDRIVGDWESGAGNIGGKPEKDEGIP